MAVRVGGIGSSCVSGGIVGKYYENLCKESEKSATMRRCRIALAKSIDS
jgi:hypothetical protein